MSTPPSVQLDSAPYLIGHAVFELLQAAPELAGVRLLSNPTRASDLSDGERVVFVEDQHDKLIAQPGQMAHREYSFTVGVINRSPDARRAAHADYKVCRAIVRSKAMAAINRLIDITGRGLQEGDVTYRLENIDVGGSLILGVYTVDYRPPR